MGYRNIKSQIATNKWRLLLLSFVIVYALIVLLNLTKTPIRWDEISHLNSGSLLYMGRFSDFLHNAFYPPLFDVITFVSFKTFSISLFTARLPAVFFAVLSLWAVFELTNYMYDGKTALLAAIMLGIMPGFFWLSSHAMLETILIFFSTVSLFCFYRWLNTHQDRMLALSGLALGLGFLAKYQTPIVAGLIMIFSIIIFARKPIKTTFKKFSKGIIAAVLVAAPWIIIAFQVYKSEFLGQWIYVLQVGNPGRSVYSTRFPLPIFYFIEMVWPHNNFHPISIFCYILGLTGLVWIAWRRRHQDKFILLWFAVVYVFFTIISNKDWRYVTPLFPTLAIAAATLILTMGSTLQKAWKKPRSTVKKRLVKITSIVIVTTIATGAMLYSIHDSYRFTRESYITIDIKSATNYVYTQGIGENKSIMVLCPFDNFNKDMVQFYLWIEGDRDTEIIQYPPLAVDAYTPHFDLVEFTEQCKQNNVQYIIFCEYGGATVPYYNTTLNLRQIYEQFHASDDFTKITEEQTFGGDSRRIFIISFIG